MPSRCLSEAAEISPRGGVCAEAAISPNGSIPRIARIARIAKVTGRRAAGECDTACISPF